MVVLVAWHLVVTAGTHWLAVYRVGIECALGTHCASSSEELKRRNLPYAGVRYLMPHSNLDFIVHSLMNVEEEMRIKKTFFVSKALMNKRTGLKQNS
jgi:hypothetical protein